MKENIAVIGANAPLIPFYRQAKALGYYIVGIAWPEGAVCKEYCDKFYPVSFADKEKVLEICREEKVDGITSFSLESALPTLVYVAQNLGLVSNTEDCVRRTQTKYAQREAFEENGIPVPRYYKVEKEEDLKKINLQYPAIVKPLDGGGSQGISMVNSPGELRDAYKDAINHSRTNRAIVEEYVDGREFSVEALSHNGTHFIVQITDKVTSGAPHFIELQHHQPANISEDIAIRIKETVCSALTALKIENSPSHTEIKLNTRGELYIIEIGARMGGGFITSDLVRLSTGYDLVEGAIQLAVNKFVVPVCKQQMYSGVYFYCKLTPEIGKIIKCHEKYPEIVEWEIVDEPLKDVKCNADRQGHFIYQSSNGRLNFS